MTTYNRSADYSSGIAAAVIFAIGLAAVGGWIANIAKIVWSLNDPITPLFMARCIGVIAGPVGAVLGYF